MGNARWHYSSQLKELSYANRSTKPMTNESIKRHQTTFHVEEVKTIFLNPSMPKNRNNISMTP